MVMFSDAFLAFNACYDVWIDFLSNLLGRRMNASAYIPKTTISDDKQINVTVGIGCSIGC